MKWVNVNEKYLDYLRKFETRIPKTDYGSDRYKPFFGILFSVNDLYYITQISHPQKRHEKMKNQKDFFKIFSPRASKELLAVVNLNYMFPIPKTDVYPFYKHNIEEYRTFKSNDEKNKYIRLLDLELASINELDLDIKAKNIYELKYQFPDSVLAKRCLDYKALEIKALKWLNEI